MDPALIPYKILWIYTVRLLRSHILEVGFWLVLSLLVSGPFWATFWDSGHLLIAFDQNYYSFLLGTIIFLFPFIFRLIFDALPLEALRTRRRALRHLVDNAPPATPGTIVLPPLADALLNLRSPEEMLAVLATESKSLSEKIYTRAGVYLLVGVLMALTGLVFFYVQSLPLTTTQELPALLAGLAPRVGVLFFIELVAFFFLRQYRAAMGEFRYFEAIKRNREENLALILLTTKKWDDVDIYKVIQLCMFNVNIGRIAAGETTELLETRKLTKDELAIFEKIVDILAKPKS